jgi:hypothetical protein
MKRHDHPNSQMTVKANTVLKVLRGGAGLTLLDILVRESIQNTLDATDQSQNGYINFFFDTVDYQSHEDLIKRFSILKIKDEDPLFQRLTERIKRGSSGVIILSDKGTTGLSGPVRRTDESWGISSIRKNFENLVYELGQNHGADMSGGSFGFGKSVYFRVSEAGLIMYYSRSSEGERLAFCMISSEEQNVNEFSTGISWWGEEYVYNGINYATPITDEVEIEVVLQKLNLINFRLRPDETGTVICIVSPKLTSLLSSNSENEVNPEKFTTLELKVEFEKAVQKWYWPRMIETQEVNPNKKIKQLKFFSSGIGIDLSVQNQKKGTLLMVAENSNAGYLADDSEIRKDIITHNYGNVKLGTLAYTIVDIKPDISVGLNTIAMIRGPRMVVYELEISCSKSVSFAAVFLVNSKELVYRNRRDLEMNKNEVILDNAFKASESSTHSEWNYQNIAEEDIWFRYYVRKVISECKTKIENALSSIVEIKRDYTEWAPYALQLGNLLFTDDTGSPENSFRGGIKPGVAAGGVSSGGKKPTFFISNQEFFEDGRIQFKFHLKNIKKSLYKIILKASGGGESLTQDQWKSKLGYDFPFQICNAESLDIEIIESNEAMVSFKGVVEKGGDSKIFITIKTLKKDALIDFEIISN